MQHSFKTRSEARDKVAAVEIRSKSRDKVTLTDIVTCVLKQHQDTTHPVYRKSCIELS